MMLMNTNTNNSELYDNARKIIDFDIDSVVVSSYKKKNSNNPPSSTS